MKVENLARRHGQGRSALDSKKLPGLPQKPRETLDSRSGAGGLEERIRHFVEIERAHRRVNQEP